MNLGIIILTIITAVGLKPATALVQHNTATSIQVKAFKTTTPVKTGLADLKLGSRSVLAVDVESGQVLYKKEVGGSWPIASLTKIMTALVILRDHQPDEMVTIPKLDYYRQGDALAGLVIGDQITVKDLLAMALIPSDNDAADTLAIYDSGTKEKFYGKMNDIAKEWGLSNTTFASASGLQDVGNASSATDVATMSRLALHNKLFTELVKTKTTRVTSQQGRVYTLESTNQLLADVRTHGVKTGYTIAAGECLVTLSTIDGHEVITVVLGSRDRFGETTQLLNWITANYSWHTTN